MMYGYNYYACHTNCTVIQNKYDLIFNLMVCLLLLYGWCSLGFFCIECVASLKVDHQTSW